MCLHWYTLKTLKYIFYKWPPPHLHPLKTATIVFNIYILVETWFRYYYYWSLLYSRLSRADSLRSHVILPEWIAFYSAFLNIHRSGVLTALTWLVPHETAACSARSVYTTQPCTMSLRAKPHTWAVCVFSCNLPPALLVYQGLLRATAVNIKITSRTCRFETCRYL